MNDTSTYYSVPSGTNTTSSAPPQVGVAAPLDQSGQTTLAAQPISDELVCLAEWSWLVPIGSFLPSTIGFFNGVLNVVYISMIFLLVLLVGVHMI